MRRSGGCDRAYGPGVVQLQVNLNLGLVVFRVLHAGHRKLQQLVFTAVVTRRGTSRSGKSQKHSGSYKEIQPESHPRWHVRRHTARGSASAPTRSCAPRSCAPLRAAEARCLRHAAASPAGGNLLLAAQVCAAALGQPPAAVLGLRAEASRRRRARVSVHTGWRVCCTLARGPVIGQTLSVRSACSGYGGPGTCHGLIYPRPACQPRAARRAPHHDLSTRCGPPALECVRASHRKPRPHTLQLSNTG